MEFIPLELKDSWEIKPRVFSDQRGSFITVYSEEEFRKRGLINHWIAENQSHNLHAGTLRGFHFQLPPAAQTKLVRVASGRAWDVIIDLRSTSPTYLKWAAVELKASEGNSIYVPQGFAHAYLTLEPNTTVVYLVDHPYAPDKEGGIRWDDPQLQIPWPWEEEPILSPKDRSLPYLTDFRTPFF